MTLMQEPAYSFDYHRAHPDVSLDQHVKGRSIALGKAVTGKETIYLDKRFWIILRDVEIGRKIDKPSRHLLGILKEKVSCGESICPISESVFIELYKQDDMFTRNKTAQIIDELSLGVTLVPFPTRVNTEIAHFLYHLSGIGELWPLQYLMWSKLSYVMGIMHPTVTPFEASEELVIQKAFFDHMWGINLSDMVSQIGSSSFPPIEHEKLANALNTGND